MWSVNDYGTEFEYFCALEERIRPASVVSRHRDRRGSSSFAGINNLPNSSSVCLVMFLLLPLPLTSPLPEKTTIAVPAFQIPSKTNEVFCVGKH